MNLDEVITSANFQDANLLTQAGIPCEFEEKTNLLFVRSEDRDKIRALLPDVRFAIKGKSTSYTITVGTDDIHTVWRHRTEGDVGWGAGPAPLGCEEIARFRGAADAFAAFVALDKAERPTALAVVAKPEKKHTNTIIGIALALTVFCCLAAGWYGLPKWTVIFCSLLFVAFTAAMEIPMIWFRRWRSRQRSRSGTRI